MEEMCKQYVSDCEICTTYNPKWTVRPDMSKFPIPVVPGKEIVIDYTDMIKKNISGLSVPPGSSGLIHWVARGVASKEGRQCYRWEVSDQPLHPQARLSSGDKFR